MTRQRILAGLITAAAVAAAVAAPAAQPGERLFDYFRNSWNVVGLKDYERGTRITPDNQLLLAGKDRVSIFAGDPLTPLSRTVSRSGERTVRP